MKPLSIIIITYNRPADTLLLLQNIAEQQNAVQLLESVVIIDNASNADYTTVKEYITSQQAIPFNYICSEENLGVARGRNKALEYAHAPYIVTIDDDAYFKEKNSLVKIKELFESDYTKEHNVGIYCFKVFYGSTGEMQKGAFPQKKFDDYKDKERFLTYYFIGCGHAIKKQVYDETGTYPTDFFYGMEEYDLGYRALDKGYSIAYDSSVSIIHNESPLGRTPHAEKMKMLWVNKSKVAYRYLPYKYFVSTALMWSLEFLKKTSFNWGLFFKGWKNIISIPHTEKKQTLSKKAMNYIREVDGRIWY